MLLCTELSAALLSIHHFFCKAKLFVAKSILAASLLPFRLPPKNAVPTAVMPVYCVDDLEAHLT